jgi:hypothetical protein
LYSHYNARHPYLQTSEESHPIMTHFAPPAVLSTTSRARVRWRRWNLVGLSALTAYSTALAWQAQLVSYPLYRAVSPDGFAAYHQQYNESIPWVVVVPGFVSFLSAAAFYWTRPAVVARSVAAVVSLTGVSSVLTTVFWAIPMHDRLDRVGQSLPTIDSLLDANLVRSLGLTVGTIALCWCLGRASADAAQDAAPRAASGTAASRPA